MTKKNELYHFGVKGQKWGLRQWQNKDGSLTEAGRKHYGYGDVKDTILYRSKYSNKMSSSFDKLYGAYATHPITSRIKGTKAYKRTDDASGEYLNAAKKVRNANKKLDEYKKDPNYRKNVVKGYQKDFDDASKKQETLDEEWMNIKQMYKQTGKSSLDRVINNFIGESKEVKAYKKAYDEWSKKQDALDEVFDDVREIYKETGSNAVSRILNNIKYEDKKKG